MRCDVDIVDVGDVDARQRKPGEAGIQRAQRSVVGVVVVLHERQPVDVAVLDAGRIRPRRQQPPHLGREQEAVARHAGERPSEASLRLALTVERRGVEVVDAAA